MIHQILDRSKELGFLGPGSIDDQVDHSERFGVVLDDVLLDWPEPRSDDDDRPVLADIGAGGGVPSLPLLVKRPGIQAVLIDASQRRCSFLVWACAELGLSDRVSVWCGRLEDIAHEDRARTRFDAVVARGFGPPAITAECASGLLKVEGHLIVSEPPEGRTWPPEALQQLGFRQISAVDQGFAVLKMVGRPPSDVPRSFKLQQRRPLF